ncbi:hypothetical protein EON83_18735 [bacterium]|nr:MAG: hypothetical protein EON83_18735 [bacterium]
MKTYWKVALLGWQDSLVYRFNSLIWILYSLLPSLTLMLVWLAAYGSQGAASKFGGFDLPSMMTYYLFVTALSVAITPNPEWDIAQTIRDGKLTPFLLRPVGYFGYRFAWESSYQVVKTSMMLPAFFLLWWSFRQYISAPSLGVGHSLAFVASCALAYVILSQLKFMLGLSAFWLQESGGLIEIWNVLSGLFSGRLLPMALLPAWAKLLGEALPFSVMYAFPMDILLGRIENEAIWWGLARQLVWIGVLSGCVRLMWARGLRQYESVGG